MFYYAWLLGLPMAAFFATLMCVLYEVREDADRQSKK